MQQQVTSYDLVFNQMQSFLSNNRPVCPETFKQLFAEKEGYEYGEIKILQIMGPSSTPKIRLQTQGSRFILRGRINRRTGRLYVDLAQTGTGDWREVSFA